MRVTTEILGNEATVVVEDEGTGANAVRTDTVTVDDNGRLTYAAFAGKTIDFIKRYFRGDVDGTNIIGRNSTTLFSDGVLTVGTFLAGQSVNILQLGETFYTSDAKVFADQSEQSAANALTSANNAENAEIAAEAARDEIVGKFNFTGNEDDLYQIDASGVAQPVSRENLSAQRELFKKAFPAQMVDYDNLHLWGPPNAPYSGQTPAAGFGVFSQKININVSNLIVTGAVIELLIKNTSSTSQFIQVGYGIDENNFYRWQFNRLAYTLFKTVAGVETQVATGSTLATNLRTGLTEKITIYFPNFSGIAAKRQLENAWYISSETALDVRNFTFIAFGANGEANIKTVLVQGDRITSIP